MCNLFAASHDHTIPATTFPRNLPNTQKEAIVKLALIVVSLRAGKLAAQAVVACPLGFLNKIAPQTLQVHQNFAQKLFMLSVIHTPDSPSNRHRTTPRATKVFGHGVGES